MFSNYFSVAVMVSDGKKSAEWYKAKLDFEVSTEDDHWVTAGEKGAMWKLHLCESENLEPGNTGICFYTDDIEQKVKDLKSKGVKFSLDYSKAEGGGEIAMFDDPDGNVFWISKGTP
jgi:catechol 2,3-dioxygenase-like lactoylglutathione lyase family enzyme